ncbi:MAG: phenylalanine--tRNA ligase subunit alpha [Candidatus Saganbacteria bacterium]|nr:phenylalanine--tRNA ligase subunit alpha [Candidatus Saganbacteria bacterium]
MEETVKNIEAKAIEEIESVSNLEALEAFRVKYLGRKAQINDLMKNLKQASPEERPKIGAQANVLRNQLEEIIAKKKTILEEQDFALRVKADAQDVTLPANKIVRGKKHPITQVLEEMIAIFKELGYIPVEGPDVETDYYNFEALNIPKHHPSREMQATFYVKEGELLLRTHTSPVQIRVLKSQKPPLAIIAPGRVYRCDADVTHSPVFHQVEGLIVDKKGKVSFTDLKGTLTEFLHRFFGKNKRVRFRPSFFPFTEPSAEVDVECIICDGAGCRLCKDSGWIEILGAGMIDPNVLEAVGLDPELYSGFAFGIGVERLAMLKFGIDDIRLFFTNDLRFLKQF